MKAATLAGLCLLIAIPCGSLFAPPCEAGVLGVQPIPETPLPANHLVGLRYKLRANQNVGNFPARKILFIAPLFSAAGYPMGTAATQIQTSLYSQRITYSDTACTGFPAAGTYFESETGLWLRVPDFSLTGRVGVRPADVSMFPRQNEGIDGIFGFTALDAIAQVNMTGKDIEVELLRDVVFTDDLTNWGYRFDPVTGECLAPLPAGEQYRKWHMSVDFDGQSYVVDWALADEYAQYLLSDQVLSIRSEFFELPGFIQIFIWDVAVLEEGSTVWTPLNTFLQNESICEGELYPPEFCIGWGMKLATYQGHDVAELSNDRTDTYDNRVGHTVELSPGLIFTPTADSKVKSTSATNNYGTEETLRLRGGSPEWRTYLKFDLSGLSAGVSSAILRLYVTEEGSIGGDSDDGGSVFWVADSWTETDINWNNAPLISGSPLDGVGSISEGTWVEYDVSSAVTGDGTISFGITSQSTDSAIFSSKEGSHPPELVVPEPHTLVGLVSGIVLLRLLDRRRKAGLARAG